MMDDEDITLVMLANGHYRRLWQLLEDLETLLWKIKELNDDIERTPSAEK